MDRRTDYQSTRSKGSEDAGLSRGWGIDRASRKRWIGPSSCSGGGRGGPHPHLLSSTGLAHVSFMEEENAGWGEDVEDGGLATVMFLWREVAEGRD